MRYVHKHADAVHFVDDRPAKGGQTDVLIVTATAREVVAVVGEQHLTHAETMIELDHLDPAIERIHPFDVEAYRHPALGFGAADVVDGGGKRELVAMFENPMPEDRKSLHGVRHGKRSNPTFIDK